MLYRKLVGLFNVLLYLSKYKNVLLTTLDVYVIYTKVKKKKRSKEEYIVGHLYLNVT